MLLLPRARAAEARGGDNASQLAEFVEQTPDAVVITDSVGRVLMANPAFQSMCVGGPAEHPLKGRLLTDLLGDPGHRLSGLVAEPRPLLACTQVAGGAARAGCGWLHRVPDQGVLAVKLCTRRPDHLMGLRKERLLTVTWAGDPAKPMVNNDPLQSRLALVCRLVRDRARHRVALARCRAGASVVLHAKRDIKPCLCARGVVANPRDAYGHRCGLRLATGANPSVFLSRAQRATPH